MKKYITIIEESTSTQVEPILFYKGTLKGQNPAEIVADIHRTNYRESDSSVMSRTYSALEYETDTELNDPREIYFSIVDEDMNNIGWLRDPSDAIEDLSKLHFEKFCGTGAGGEEWRIWDDIGNRLSFFTDVYLEDIYDDADDAKADFLDDLLHDVAQVFAVAKPHAESQLFHMIDETYALIENAFRKEN